MNSTCQECGHTQPVHFTYSPAKPTMEGWYWYVGVEYGQPVVLHVYPHRLGYLVIQKPESWAHKNDHKKISEMTGQWSGRIPAPL